MQATLTQVAVVVGVATIATLTGSGGYKAFDKITSAPGAPSIELVGLTFQDGKVGQELVVSGADLVPATWTAQINRTGQMEAICIGSGSWNYKARPQGSVAFFTPSEWTEDECPVLQPGDRLSVTYQYKTFDGEGRVFVATPGGELVLTPDMFDPA